MRTEQEVRQMIGELKAIDHPDGWKTARAVIAALENVLNGPCNVGKCWCMGPSGCCICKIKGLASLSDNHPTSEELDPYYARDHDRGPGSWCVGGPGFKMPVPDKMLAYAIGKLLSGKTKEAAGMAADWVEAAKEQLAIK